MNVFAPNIAANSGIDPGTGQDAESSSTRTTPADKAAEMIVNGIEKDSCRVLVGKDARLMDFLIRLNPKGAAKLIYKQMASYLPD